MWTTIWDSGDFLRLSPEARLVILCLKTSPDSTIVGISRAVPQVLAFRTGLSVEAVETSLKTLAEGNEPWIVRSGEYVWIRNGLKHDPTFAHENNNHVKWVVKGLKSLPPNADCAKLVSLFVSYYAELGMIPAGMLQPPRSHPQSHPHPIPTHPNHIHQTPDTRTKERKQTQGELGLVAPVGATAGELAGIVFDHWVTTMKKDKARTKLTPERLRLIKARLKDGYSADDLKRAIDGCASSAFHMGENDRNTPYDDITLICRNGSKVETFMGMAHKGKPRAREAPATPRPQSRKGS